VVHVEVWPGALGRSGELHLQAAGPLAAHAGEDGHRRYGVLLPCGPEGPAALEVGLSALEGTGSNEVLAGVEVDHVDIVEDDLAGLLAEAEVHGAALLRGLGADELEGLQGGLGADGERGATAPAVEHPGAYGLAVHDKSRCPAGGVHTNGESARGRGEGGERQQRTAQQVRLHGRFLPGRGMVIWEGIPRGGVVALGWTDGGAADRLSSWKLDPRGLVVRDGMGVPWVRSGGRQTAARWAAPSIGTIDPRTAGGGRTPRAECRRAFAFLYFYGGVPCGDGLL